MLERSHQAGPWHQGMGWARPAAQGIASSCLAQQADQRLPGLDRRLNFRRRRRRYADSYARSSAGCGALAPRLAPCRRPGARALHCLSNRAAVLSRASPGDQPRALVCRSERAAYRLPCQPTVSGLTPPPTGCQHWYRCVRPVSCLVCGCSRRRGVDIFIHRLRCLSFGWGLRALSSLLSAMQGQKALGPEPLQATTHTEAASRRLRVGGAVG